MQKNTKIAWVLLAIAFIGFLDATYLTTLHYRGVIPPCTLLAGCETVTTSGYATLMNVPVALLGSIYYLGVISLLFWYLQKENLKILQHVKYLTIAGLAASAYFVYLQIFVIGAICQYCMLSAGTSTALFLISWLALRAKRLTINY